MIIAKADRRLPQCTLKAFTLSVLLVVSVAFGLTAYAAQTPANPGNRPDHAGPPQDVVDQLLDRGFQQIQPSIFERKPADTPTSYETVVYGIDGHLWLLGQQEAFLETLEARYERFPAPELLDAILAQERWIEGTLALLDEMLTQEASGQSLDDGLKAVRLGSGEVISVGEAVTSCSTTLARAASAGPSATGPTASGSASFSDTCSEMGTVSSFSTAQGTDSSGNINTFTQDCPDDEGEDVSCDTSATVVAESDCFAGGLARVLFGSFTHTVSETSSTCRSLSASLTGTTSLFVPAGSTRTASWTVTPSNGETPYNYQWLYNNAAVGTDSPSYSRSYTHPGIGFTRTDTVKVTVSDSSMPTQSDTETLTIQVTYANTCTDPCFCPFSTVGGINLETVTTVCP